MAARALVSQQAGASAALRSSEVLRGVGAVTRLLGGQVAGPHLVLQCVVCRCLQPARLLQERFSLSCLC